MDCVFQKEGTSIPLEFMKAFPIIQDALTSTSSPVHLLFIKTSFIQALSLGILPSCDNICIDKMNGKLIRLPNREHRK